MRRESLDVQPPPSAALRTGRRRRRVAVGGRGGRASRRRRSARRRDGASLSALRRSASVHAQRAARRSRRRRSRAVATPPGLRSASERQLPPTPRQHDSGRLVSRRRCRRRRGRSRADRVARGVGLSRCSTPTSISAREGRWQRVLAGAYTDPQMAARRTPRALQSAVVPVAPARVVDRRRRPTGAVDSNREPDPRRASAPLAEPTVADGEPETARADAVLATLGYPRPTSGAASSPQKTLLCTASRRSRSGSSVCRWLISAARAVGAAAAGACAPAHPRRDGDAAGQSAAPAADSAPASHPSTARPTPRPSSIAAPTQRRRRRAAARGGDRCAPRRPQRAGAAPAASGTAHRRGRQQRRRLAAAPRRRHAAAVRPPGDAAAVARSAEPPASAAPPCRRGATAPTPARGRTVAADAGSRPRRAAADDHFGLALYYQRVGDFDNALAHYRALLEQNDASAEVHNNLGLLYQDRGQLDDAMKQFQRAIAIDPKYVKAHNNLGVALHAREPAGRGGRGVPRRAGGRPAQRRVARQPGARAEGRAAASRTRAICCGARVAIDPRSAGSHYNLAVVADEAGDTATADRALPRVPAARRRRTRRSRRRGPRAPDDARRIDRSSLAAPTLVRVSVRYPSPHGRPRSRS